MFRTLLRAGGAMLLVAAACPASGQDYNAYPAIATGLAIPSGSPSMQRTAVPVSGRAIIVDAKSARLFMMEDGQVVDSMRVIVGKPSAATPSLKSTLYYATLNPYWNVPVDLSRSLIAPNVLKLGMNYLREKGYEVVSEFSEDARILDPESVDWQAVADGREKVFVRQRPGPANSMGRVKFGFRNDDGIFLHDTPRKELFAEDSRNLSNGCVRLEDADRLARWMFGGEPPRSGIAEMHVPLPRPVPIVITYLGEGTPMEMAALR